MKTDCESESESWMHKRRVGGEVLEVVVITALMSSLWLNFVRGL